MNDLAVPIARCKYLKRLSVHEACELHISGSGVMETMPPIMLDRPNGTGDRMLMYFYSEMQVKLRGEVVTVPPRSLILWPDKAPHFYGNSAERWTHSWLHFEGRYAETLLKKLRIPEETALPLCDPDFLERILFLIYLELVREKTSAAVLHSLFTALMCGIDRDLHSQPQRRIPESIQKSIHFIHNAAERAEEGFTLAEAAENAGFSVPRFCALFRQFTGTSPLRFYRTRVMERAAELLLNRNLSVSEIAELCGYSDIFQFTRAVKRHFGLSPTAIRNGK